MVEPEQNRSSTQRSAHGVQLAIAHTSSSASTRPSNGTERPRWAADASTFKCVARCGITSRPIVSIAVAVVAGTAYGLLLAPMYLAHTRARGLAFLPSFSIGIGMCAFFCLALHFCPSLGRSDSDQGATDVWLLGRGDQEAQRSTVPETASRSGNPQKVWQKRWAAAAVLGGMAGVIWNIGNACSIIATDKVHSNVCCCIAFCLCGTVHGL